MTTILLFAYVYAALWAATWLAAYAVNGYSVRFAEPVWVLVHSLRGFVRSSDIPEMAAVERDARHICLLSALNLAIFLSPIVWVQRPQYHAALALIWLATSAGADLIHVFKQRTWTSSLTWLALVIPSYAFSFALVFPDNARPWTQPYAMPVVFGTACFVLLLPLIQHLWTISGIPKGVHYLLNYR